MRKGVGGCIFPMRLLCDYFSLYHILQLSNSVLYFLAQRLAGPNKSLIKALSTDHRLGHRDIFWSSSGHRVGSLGTFRNPFHPGFYSKGTWLFIIHRDFPVPFLTSTKLILSGWAFCSPKLQLSTSPGFPKKLLSEGS